MTEPKPTPHEADLIKSAELLMRVIPAEARAEIMRGYCAVCGNICVSDECWCQYDKKPTSILAPPC